MKAMILAAGRGERLSPLTLTTPKPMLPVRGKPLIERQVESLGAAGFTDIVINLHHLGEKISSHLGNGQQHGVNIVYSREETLLDTGGGIVKALPLLGEKPFLVLNGDIYSHLNFAGLPHQLKPNTLAHLVLTPTPAHRAKGDFNYAEGKVIGRGNDFVYTGVAVCDPCLFDGCSATPFSWMKLVFPATTQGKITGEIYDGEWTDIGSLEQYHTLNESADYD